MSEAFDFSRYAPEPRPQLAWDNPASSMPDDLTQALFVMGACLVMALKCGALTIRIIRRRAFIASHRLINSLQVAWSLTGMGWGAFAGLFLFQVFSR